MKLCVILAFISSLGHLHFSMAKYILTLKKLECTHNNKFIAFNYCYVKPIKRGVQRLQINYTFMSHVEEMWTRIETFKRYGNSYKPFVVSWNSETCKIKAKLTSKPSLNNVAMIILQAIMKEERGCHPCPFDAGETCEIGGWDVHGDFLPPFIPNGGYKMTFELHDGVNQSFGKVGVFGHLVDK